MNFLLSFWRSTIGAKVVVALTGMFLLGFVIFHMLGNLQVFLGAEAFNAYGAMMHSKPELLWVARLGILGAFGLHMFATFRLVRLSAAARPNRYAVQKSQASTLYSKTMIVTGPIVLIFFVVHLLNFTTGADVGGVYIHPDYRVQGHVPEAFHNLTTLLSNPIWGAFYIVAVLALGSHLWHGAFSMAKTLGLSSERHLRLAQGLASLLTLTFLGGNVTIVLACMLKLV